MLQVQQDPGHGLHRLALRSVCHRRNDSKDESERQDS
jgi:hypothetical protein